MRDKQPSRPLRVMHLMFMLRTGGMELGVAKLANGLDRSRVLSSICSCLPAEPRARMGVDARVPLFELRRRDGNDPVLVARLYRLFRRERPDVVHTHAWGTLCEGLLAAKAAGVPVMIHGEHGTLQTRRHTRPVQRWAWGRTDQVLSVSSVLADRMAADVGFPRDRVRVIRNGVDLARFSGAHREEARRRLGLPAGDIVIGSVGRLHPVKDQQLLLRAVQGLRSEGLAVRGIVAGSGDLLPSLEAEAARLGLGDAFRFLGDCRDIERVLAAMDIFALPSRSEGLSNTILEAMASRLPVVATRVGGTPEIVSEERTGLLIPPQDPGALTAALRTLVQHPDRRVEMGERGRRRACGEFSLERMFAGYEQMYEEVWARSGRTRSLVEAA